MKHSVVWFVSIVLVLIVGIAIIDAGVDRPINWDKTYNMKDKSPFGLFVLKKELNNILEGERQISTFGSSYYEQVTVLDSVKRYDVAFVEVGYGSYYWYDEDMNKVLDYVDRGGELFISASGISTDLLDTLGLKMDYLSYHQFSPTDKNTSFSLVGLIDTITLEKNDDYVVFSKLNPETTTILGHIHIKEHTLPNFIAVKHGKGYFYFHLAPVALTNFNLLDSANYPYAAHVLNVINREQLYVYDPHYYSEEAKTPLRVILGLKGFSQAWYLLLLGLVLLLVVKSRREQRAVSVVLPEPNLSKEFAKTIGALYYESGQPGNIVKKKIDYFLYDLRAHFQVDTLDLRNKKMIRQIALKSGIEESFVETLMHDLARSYKQIQFTFEDVKRVNHQIEEFKRKANFI